MNPLATFFEHAGFDAASVTQLVQCFTARTVLRGQFFVQEQTVANELAFLAQGTMQYFTLTEKGEERTTYVSLPGTFVASLLSFLTEAPARENIRAISDSTVWTINKAQFLALQQQLPAFKDFYIGLLEWQICCIDKGKFDLIALSADDRYQKILREEPQLLQQVPLQYIASMLGVTPRHLSRLRAKS